MVTPAARREAAAHLGQVHGIRKMIAQLPISTMAFSPEKLMLNDPLALNRPLITGPSRRSRANKMCRSV
jgi:hypothetical protein